MGKAAQLLFLREEKKAVLAQLAIKKVKIVMGKAELRSSAVMDLMDKIG